MNTDKFDKHAKNNLAFYEGFLEHFKICCRSDYYYTRPYGLFPCLKISQGKGVAAKPHFLNSYNLMSRISADNVVLREEVGNLNCCIIIAIRTMYRISFNRLRK